MKKLIVASSALLASLTLVGCNTMSDVGNYTSSTVGTGMKYGAQTIGAGVGVVANTGAAVGKGVGTVVGAGAGLLTGQPVYSHQRNVVYHNGHRYVLKNGRYVRVQ